LDAFVKIHEEINNNSLEYDFRPRFIEYLVKGFLGYRDNEYIFDKKLRDIILLDENDFRVVIIETKRANEDLTDEEWQSQAFGYADETTKYMALTDGYHFILWEIKNGRADKRVDMNFKSIFDSGSYDVKQLDSHQIQELLFLNNLKKDEIWNESKYEEFNEFYGRIDVSTPRGFDRLINVLNQISNNLLKQYTFNAFDIYYKGFQEYELKLSQVQQHEKQNSCDKKILADAANLEVNTHSQYKRYSSFAGFYEWLIFSNRSNMSIAENKEVFCKESIYALMSRLLFIRICEDKDLLKKRISNGGTDIFKQFVDNPEEAYKQVLELSYKNASSIYSHFYEKGNPLDWYYTGDGNLNKCLNRVLWLLNHFNFSKVDKDILGKIYEQYLPRSERRRLGEFYTPDEVIDHILDVIGYVPTEKIEHSNIIDPACGLGGFLVRAARRLIARYAIKFGRSSPDESLYTTNWPTILQRLTPKECEIIIDSVTEHIYGLDINPFAIHITEMNLLFQLIDLYQKAKQENKGFQLGRFKVYRTDSLELPTQNTDILQYSSPTGQMLAQNRNEIIDIKKKKYDFVVGNPPNVKIANWHTPELANYYRKNYSCVTFKNFDLYMLFIELGIKLLKDNGKLSYICSNQFMKGDCGFKLRKFIVENSFINEIVDFKHNPVFDSGTNYSAIIVLSRARCDDVTVTRINRSINRLYASNILERIQQSKISGTRDTDFKTFCIKFSKFQSSDWEVEDEQTIELIKKLKSTYRKVRVFRDWFKEQTIELIKKLKSTYRKVRVFRDWFKDR
jgi:type I restriction-modification system DNA methylase subunit